MKKKVVFVCIENSNRSQMAQAFAIMHASGFVESFSAGSHPSGRINPRAIATMKELGYDLSTHASKAVNELPLVEFDYVIGMGCGDNCPTIRAHHRLEWQIPDPRHMEEEEFRAVRDLIEQKVKELIKNIKEG